MATIRLPNDVPPIKATKLDGSETKRTNSDDEPFAAVAFSHQFHPYLRFVMQYQQILIVVHLYHELIQY